MRLTGVASSLQLAMKSADPSFLAVPPSRDALYAVNEDEDYPQPDGGKGGSVTAFRRDPASGKLTEQNIVPSGGSGPCYITVDRAGRAAFVANYNNGTLASFRVTPKGLEGPVTVFAAHGSGPNKERQKGPHLHCTVLSPDERFLLVSDLGTDHIWIFHVDPKTAELKETGAPWQAKPGSGPRHTHFHPNGKWVYSINEMTSTVDVLAWDAKNGTLKGSRRCRCAILRTQDRAMPQSWRSIARAGFSMPPTAAKICWSSSRSIRRAALLHFVQRIGCGGKNPRDFTLDPSEKWLVVSNQDTQNIAVFARDPHSGKLTADRSELSRGRAGCRALVSVAG